MRCFEATGCGAVLLSDAGCYPEGVVDGGNHGGVFVYPGAGREAHGGHITVDIDRRSSLANEILIPTRKNAVTWLPNQPEKGPL